MHFIKSVCKNIQDIFLKHTQVIFATLILLVSFMYLSFMFNLLIDSSQYRLDLMLFVAIIAIIVMVVLFISSWINSYNTSDFTPHQHKTPLKHHFTHSQRVGWQNYFDSLNSNNN